MSKFLKVILFAVTVVNTTETTVNGHQVWSVSVTGTGGNAARKVFVDQETGKISR